MLKLPHHCEPVPHDSRERLVIVRLKNYAALIRRALLACLTTTLSNTNESSSIQGCLAFKPTALEFVQTFPEASYDPSNCLCSLITAALQICPDNCQCRLSLSISSVDHIQWCNIQGSRTVCKLSYLLSYTGNSSFFLEGRIFFLQGSRFNESLYDWIHTY